MKVRRIGFPLPASYNSRTMSNPKSPHLLVRAARGEAVERPPVWAMRQAGRWDPEFNAVRAGLSVLRVLRERRTGRTGVAAAAPLRRRCASSSFTTSPRCPWPWACRSCCKPGSGPVPDRPIRTLADVDRSRCRTRTRTAIGTSVDCCGGEGGAARRTAGDRLRRGAVHRGDVLHRHRQGHGRHAALRRASSRASGTALLDEAGDGDGPFPEAR